jgi:tetratricopeptide (TPR) repeat protein
MRIVVSFIFFLMATGAPAAELDSLHRALRIHPREDTLRISVLNELCRYHRSNFPDSALDYGNQALALAIKIGDHKGEATALNYIGVACFFKGEYQRSMEYQKQAISVCKAHNFASLLAGALNSAALNYQYTADYVQALDFYLQALQIEESLKNDKGIAKVTANLSMLYRLLGDTEKALDFALRAFRINDRIGTTERKGALCTSIGLIYLEQKKYKEALPYLERSLQLNELTGNNYNIAISVGNLGLYYLKTEQFREAAPFVERYHQLAKTINAVNMTALSLLNLGQLRLRQGRTKEAIDLIGQCLTMSEQAKMTGRIVESYRDLADAYMISGDYRKASKAWERAYFLNDSLRGKEMADIIGKSQKSYEVAKKQSEVDRLEHEARFKELALKREKNFKLFLSLIVLLLFIVAGFALYGYRVKTGLSNELKNRYREISAQKAVIESINLELQEKAFRAQMNPHFIFNCLNSIQYLIVKGDNNEAFSYLTKFSVLLRRILEHSDKETIALEEEIALLQVYLELESLRFDHNFSYDLDYHEIAEGSVSIPPLMIQPLVENAIVHGLLRKDGDRKLGVSFRKEEEAIVCEIRDNGIGREAARKSVPARSMRQSRGVDLSRQRLTVHNNRVDDEEFIIEDLYDDYGNPAGTSVTLRFAP